ncbi:MAG: IPT/TIG domain-containing protein [bacterium]|nr:IPT/TIG domain-containing protein [bacterium]
MAPYILSIMPNSGPAGSKVTISGCNLSGFEGDLNATFVRNDGVTLPLYGGTYYRKVIDAAEPVSMTVTVKTYCPTGSEVGLYSGKDTPCKTVEATPGTYAVSVATPEGKSNAVTFTVK